MSKADFVEKFKTVRSAFNDTLSGLTDAGSWHSFGSRKPVAYY